MLLQNQTIFAQMPLRRQGGADCGSRALFGRADRRNLFAGGDQFGGSPDGYLHPASWNMPQKAGRISAYAGNDIAITGTAGMAAGINAIATGTITVDGVASMLAVATISANGTITITSAADIVGAANMTASGNFTVTGAATVQAVATMTAAGDITITGAYTPSALGFITAGPIDTAITPDVIAAAVWEWIGSGGAGSKGEELSKALKAAKLAAALSA